MKRGRSIPKLAVFGLIAALYYAGMALFGQGESSAEPGAPVALKEIRERGISGRLGRAMGTILRIEGVVIENTSKAKADEREPFFLQVNSVEGKALAPAEVFVSSALPIAKSVPGIKAGERFRCVGYERGGYTGTPDKEFDHVEPYATVGFYFSTEFVVLKGEKSE